MLFVTYFIIRYGEDNWYTNIIIIIIIIIIMTIFIVLSSWQSHCESSLDSHGMVDYSRC